MTALVDSRQLAELLGVSQPKASKILRLWFSGKPWNGHVARVQATIGRGGRAGIVYRAIVNSLPAELRAKAPQSARAVAPIARETKRALTVWLKKRGWRKGRKRVLISQRWDSKVDLPSEKKAEIAAKLRHYARRAWASGAPSCLMLCDLATAHLILLTREAGFDRGTVEMKFICAVPAHFVEPERERYSKVHKKRTNAKGYEDDDRPDILRFRDFTPMKMVAGDAHHIDIYVRRDDGKLATPKMVAWLDLATNRVFYTLYLLEKNEGICREHIAKSFAQMCTHPEWGKPQAVYLDNGPEYKWTESLEDFLRLGIEVFDGRKAVRKARPYNAQAKVIESTFATLEKTVFAVLPGYIGGNRMKAKTHNVGREPNVFPGTLAEFESAIADAVAFYHARRQAGHLAGRSPIEAFNAFAEWKRTDVKADALRLAFSIIATRTIDKGRIHYGSRPFANDALQGRSGESVLIRVPLVGDDTSVAVFDGRDEDFICWAAEEKRYRFDDIEGAREQSRRARVDRAEIRKREEEAPPLDMQAEMRGAAQILGQTSRQPESGGTVRLAPHIEAAARAYKKPSAGERRRLEEEAAKRRAEDDAAFIRGLDQLESNDDQYQRWLRPKRASGQ